MGHDEVVIVATAVGWAGAVGALGLLVAWRLHGVSLRWIPVGVAVVAVSAVVAGVIGTARAMFLSDHDYRVVLWVCGVAGLVAALVSMLIGAALVRWSGRLREGARQLGETGEYEVRVGGPAEFSALSDQLRETSEKLARSRARERRLEESRRELVSWVSHDLRTPLAGLRAMAEALEDGMAEDPARYHRRIRDEVDRTVRMVDDLFELSQIDAGLAAPALEDVSLHDLVSESLAGAESVAAAKGVRLHGEVESDVLLRADPDAISRALGNLLMNAIRHTPADGSVHVHGRALPAHVELSVRDGCGGIPEHEIDRVFEVAFRGGAARTPTVAPDLLGAGAGLGLAIVRGIVEAHRGRVEVDNVAGGCRFRILMPG